MSLSLRHWILWPPGQLSSVNTSAKINISINQYPEIGDDAVVGTDNDAGGTISMSMNFELHAVAVDDDIFSVDTSVSWRLFLLTKFCTCRSVYCSHHILSFSFRDVFACGNNSSYS